MRALVIGASGLVGGALVRALEREGTEVVGTAHRRAGTSNRPLDVRDGPAVERCIEEVRPEVVLVAVNAPGGVDACEEDPSLARAIIVEGTLHVARAAAATGGRVVVYSSDYVFDGQAGPYGEDDPPTPVNVYGRLKLEAEEALGATCPGSLIVRTTAVFGWDPASPNFAMQVWARLSAGKEMAVPCDQWCNPTLADYLAEVTARLVGAGTGGLVNIVGADRVTRADLAVALARAYRLDAGLIRAVPTGELGQRAARPMNAGLKTDRLEAILSTRPLTLAESLQRLARQWRADTQVSYAGVSVSDQAQALRAEILGKVREYHALVHAPRSFVPYRTRIQYAGRVFGAEEMELLVESALDFWLTLGPYGDRFESRMKRYYGARDFCLVSSGSSANLLAVSALRSPGLERRLAPGDEVVTPAVTFPTTVAPLVQNGLVPVFVDCEVGTYNIDPRLVEEALGPRTRAIMVPHTLGNPCDMDVIGDVASRHGLTLIEDTCDALGSTFRGRLVGTFGALATLSFYPAHHMTMGEGGGVVVNDGRLARAVRSLRDWGRDCWCAPGESNTCGKRFGWSLGDLPAGYDHKYTYSHVGYNLKPTDLQAAIGLAQLDRLPWLLERRRANFRRLYEGLSRHSDHLVLPRLDGRSDPAWFGFPITVDGGLTRQELVQFLETAHIETRMVFAGNILRQPAYSEIPHRIHGTLERTDRIARDTFFIGVYPGLDDAMIDFVLEVFERFFESRAR